MSRIGQHVFEIQAAEEQAEAFATAFGSEWRMFKPGYYVSRDGRAAKFVRGKPYLLKGCSAGQGGYRSITYEVYKQGGRKLNRRFYLHRAVCELFHGAPLAGQYCLHSDGNPLNNSAENLRWGWPVENSADMARHGTALKGGRNPMAKLSDEQVREMRRIRACTGAPYKAIAPQFGITTMTAYRAITGQSWS